MLIGACLTALALAAAPAEPPEADEADDGATVAPSPAPPRPAVVLELGGDLDDSQRARLSNLVASRLGRFAGLLVTRQREAHLDEAALAACARDDETCLAALASSVDGRGEPAASAPGALIVSGTAARLSGQLTISLLAVTAGGALVERAQASVSGGDDEAAGAVAALVDELGQRLTGAPPQDAVGAAHASPTAETAPELRGLALTGGGVALAAGVVVFAVSAIPGALAVAAEGDLGALRVRYTESGGDRAILTEAAAKQAEVDGYRGVHNGVGVLGLWTGGLVAVAGGALLGAAFTVLDGQGDR